MSAIIENNNTTTSLEASKTAVTPEISDKRDEANAIIRKYALLSTATGLIPVFGVGVAAATAIQTKMIKDLAEVYGFDIDDQLIRTALTTGVTALGGRILTQLAGMLAGAFSPLKLLLNGTTSAAVSGFLTLEMGTLYQSKMELGENPAEIGVMEIVNHIVQQVQEGKWDPSKVSLTHQLGSMIKN